MDQMITDMMNRIMDSERMGYAYLYPSGDGERQEYILLSHMVGYCGMAGRYFHFF